MPVRLMVSLGLFGNCSILKLILLHVNPCFMNLSHICLSTLVCFPWVFLQRHFDLSSEHWSLARSQVGWLMLFHLSPAGIGLQPLFYFFGADLPLLVSLLGFVALLLEHLLQFFYPPSLGSLLLSDYFFSVVAIWSKIYPDSNSFSMRKLVSCVDSQ